MNTRFLNINAQSGSIIELQNLGQPMNNSPTKQNN
jgi:hypothetical protein